MIWLRLSNIWEDYTIVIYSLYQVKHPWLILDQRKNTRGHNLKLSKARSKLELRRNCCSNCFSGRVVNCCRNSLPAEVISADTKSFINRLNKHWRKKSLHHWTMGQWPKRCVGGVVLLAQTILCFCIKHATFKYLWYINQISAHRPVLSLTRPNQA